MSFDPLPQPTSPHAGAPAGLEPQVGRSRQPLRPRGALTLGVLVAAAVALVATLAPALAAPVDSPGFLKFEVWSGLATGDNSLDSTLLADARYPASPSFVSYTSAFSSRTVYPNDTHEGYGAKLSGWVTPPESGSYRFFIYSDDSSRLFLSTDEKPANLGVTPIAEETGCCNNFTEPDSPRTSEPISLQAGKKYYLEAIYKEGTGGDYCFVAWRKEGDATPAATLQPIPGAYLSSLAEPTGASVTISSQPQNATVAENGSVTFTIAAQTATAYQQDPGGTLPPLYQWYKNGTPIAGANGPAYTIALVKKADNQAKFKCWVAVPALSKLSDEATLTVTSDVTLPTIVSAEGSIDFTHVTVTFSEPVTAASAQAAGNYQISGLTVSAPTLFPSPNDHKVLLTTSKQTEGAEYTLTVQNIIDTAGNATAAGAKVVFRAFSKVRGGLRLEVFNNIPNTPIQGLLDDPKYQANTPDSFGYVTAFTSRLVLPDNSSGLATRENYGGRMSGWIVPAETAQYEFFIRSDDASQLYLSPDDKPENAVVIAEETGCCGPFEDPGAPETSVPQSLTSGRRYYIQALWKEGGGGDYCDVAWRKVGDPAVPRALPYIPGTVLEALGMPDTFTAPTVAFTSPADGSTFETNVPVTLTVSASAGPGKTITKVEFFDSALKVGEATTSPYSITLTGLSEDPHKFIARATDNYGLSTAAASITVNIGSRVALLLLANIDDKAGEVTTWRYDRTGRDLGTAWREKNYDDSQWPQGKALIADETTTTVEPIRTPISRFNDSGEYVRTFYFRRKFDFNFKVNPFVRLKLRHAVDDGAIFYLNGHEIHRFGITDDPVNFQSNANGHENAYEGPFDILVDRLVSGENILAAEVHQSGGSSSDMVFGAELIAIIPLVQKQLEVVKIDDKTTWRYDRTGRDLGTDWRQPIYDDSQWPQGKTLIADETTTTVEPIRTPISRFNDSGEYVRTFYFRTHFDLPVPSTQGAKLKLRHAVDDGVVIYLNGFEINRLGITDDPVNFQSNATGHENAWEGPYDIPIDHLRAGDNVLAAEVHQSGGSSSDMVFGVELIASVWSQQEEAAPSELRFTLAEVKGGTLTLQWMGAGTLWSAETVAGPWSKIDLAASPYNTAASGPRKFFRLQR